MFNFKLFRAKEEGKEEKKQPTIPTVQCKLLKDMAVHIAKNLGKTKDSGKHIYEDDILYIKTTDTHIDIAVKAEQDGEPIRVPVFKVLASATAPRLYQAGPWTDRVIDKLYPRAIRIAWDEATEMRDLGAIETPDVDTALIS